MECIGIMEKKLETTIWVIDKPPPFKGLNIRILIIIPIKGRGLINQESTLGV